MAHFRNRNILELLHKVTSFSPITGVLGHRQVGKTTLLQHYTNHYLTLDDEETFQDANQSAKQFLSKNSDKKTVLDECQLLPSLFPALKERVRLNKKPGQFIISGSVRFTSRKAIRESLTGRIVNLELLPFTISEIHHSELSNTCSTFIHETNLQSWLDRHEQTIRSTFKFDKEIEKYLIRGGLPGVCFIRENILRDNRINEQLRTILDRDIRMIYSTTLPFSQILDFVTLLAQNEGSPIRYAEIEKKIKISETTQKKILYALESVFMIRLLPIEGGRKGHICFFEDQAELHYLAKKTLSLQYQLESLIYRHIRTQWAYRLEAEVPRFFHFLNRSGVRIPICISVGSKYLCIILIEGATPSRSEKAAAQAFFRTYQNSKALFLAQNSKSMELLDDRSLLLPLSSVL